jgi:hypothetical protein
VREFFSTTAGRMLARLAESRAQLRWMVDEDGSPAVVDIARIDGRALESILVDLASLVGLWNESVVHGPAWRFGEVGRRLERAFGVIDGVRGAFGLYTTTSAGSTGRGRTPSGVRRPPARLPAPTRRRDRAGVEREPRRLPAAAPQRRRVRDGDAPRRRRRAQPACGASAMRQVRHQADRLGWQRGVDKSTALLDELEGHRSGRSMRRSRARGRVRRLRPAGSRRRRVVSGSARRSALMGRADVPGQRYRVVHRTEYRYGATMPTATAWPACSPGRRRRRTCRRRW